MWTQSVLPANPHDHKVPPGRAARERCAPEARRHTYREVLGQLQSGLTTRPRPGGVPDTLHWHGGPACGRGCVLRKSKKDVDCASTHWPNHWLLKMDNTSHATDQLLSLHCTCSQRRLALASSPPPPQLRGTPRWTRAPLSQGPGTGKPSSISVRRCLRGGGRVRYRQRSRPHQ